VVRRQPAVAPPEALHADVGDLAEHVVVLDERLLHPLRERHPLQTVFSVQKIIIYSDLLGEPTLNERRVRTFAAWISVSSILMSLDSGLSTQMKNRSDFWNATVCACLPQIDRGPQ